MNEALLIQLVVQTGALGICALMVLNTGRKMDRLAEGIHELVKVVEVMIDRRRREV